MYQIFAIFLFIIFSHISFAGEIADGEIICTKYKSTNLRAGPGKKFDISLKILKSGYPLQAVQKVDNWIAVRDYEGVEAWIAVNNMSKKCGSIIISEQSAILKYRPNEESKSLLRLERGFIIPPKIECISSWCKIRVLNKSGWIQRENLWLPNIENNNENNEN